MENRLKHLLNLYREGPEDPFILYALAKEYEKQNDLKKAEELFEQLVEAHPDYVGTYYHYGAVLEKTNQPEKAAKIYSTGLEIAQKLNDHLAYRELFAALSKFEDSDS